MTERPRPEDADPLWTEAEYRETPAGFWTATGNSLAAGYRRGLRHHYFVVAIALAATAALFLAVGFGWGRASALTAPATMTAGVAGSDAKAAAREDNGSYPIIGPQSPSQGSDTDSRRDRVPEPTSEGAETAGGSPTPTGVAECLWGTGSGQACLSPSRLARLH
jgi:hypothetical protein